MSPEYLHSDLTRKIIGASMNVHSALGNGFQESIYQRALSLEFEDQQLAYEREKEMDIYYKDVRIGTRRVDFFVEDSVMVEIKAVSKLEDIHYNQILNYLEAYGLKVGLLINFGSKSLEFRRFVK